MKKILSLLLITVLIIGNVSVVFADSTDDITDFYILDYITAPGNAYIDIDYPVFETSIWKWEFKFNFNSRRNYNVVLGSTDTYRRNYESWIDSNGRLNVRISDNTSVTTTISSTLNAMTDYIIIYDNNASNFDIWVNGSRVNNLAKLTTSLTTSDIGFGHRADGDYFIGKIYYLKVWSDGDLVRDFLPVKRISDGKCGLFDTIGSKFYPSAGSNDFGYGNIVSQYYNVSATVNPAGSGTVTGSGTYESGTNATLTATPNQGYEFVNWSDGSTQNPRTITVSQEVSLIANFQSIVQNYTVSTSVSPSGSGSVTGGGSYTAGSTATIEAIPNTGYQFVNWSDGSSVNPRSFTVNSNTSLIANFELIPDDSYLISVSVNPNGSGYVTGGGYYEENEVIELEAVPNSGYQFVGWSDGNDDNPRSITVTDDLTLIANFELINPPEPVDQDSMTLVMLLVSFLILVMLERGTVFNG